MNTTEKIDVATDPRFIVRDPDDMNPLIIGWVYGRSKDGGAPQYGGDLLRGVDLGTLDHMEVVIEPERWLDGAPSGWRAVFYVADRFGRDGRRWRSARLKLPVPKDRTPRQALEEAMMIATTGVIDTTPERELVRHRVSGAIALLADLPARPSAAEYEAWRTRRGLPVVFNGWPPDPHIGAGYDPSVDGLYHLSAEEQASVLGWLRAAWTLGDRPGWEDSLWSHLARGDQSS